MVEALPLSAYVAPREKGKTEFAPFCTLAPFYFAHWLAVEPDVADRVHTLPVRNTSLFGHVQPAVVLQKILPYGYDTALVCTGRYAGTLALPPKKNKTLLETIKTHRVPPYTPLLRSLLVIRPLMSQVMTYDQTPYLEKRIMEALQESKLPFEQERLQVILREIKRPLEEDPQYNVVEFILRLLSLHRVPVNKEQFWHNNKTYWKDMASR